jgi:N-acetylglucosamine kinase-like BadF-type ATPase
MRYFLGLDGGGTKTAACISDECGVDLGRGIGGPCNIANCHDDLLRNSVRTAVQEALTSSGLPAGTQFETVCAGVAGYSSKRRRPEFLRILSDMSPAARHRLEPDYVIAFWGATLGQPGIVVSAGTGAVAYGRNEAGESHRSDGDGFLMGDRGSGFYIARIALRMVLARLRAGRELQPFDLAVLEAMGAVDREDIIEWIYRDFQPVKVASLAIRIGELANQGDQTAQGIIYGAGTMLRISYQRVRHKLTLPEETPAYALGNLWNIGEPLIKGFHRGFDQLPPPHRIMILQPEHDSAYGAAYLAMQGDTG